VGDEREPGEDKRRGDEADDDGDVNPGFVRTGNPEHEVGEQDRGEPRQHSRGEQGGQSDDQRERDEQDRGLGVAAVANAGVEVGEGRDWVGVGSRPECVFAIQGRGRDVRDRDEPGDAGRRGGEETAIAGGEHRNRIAAVVRLRAAARQADDNRRPGRRASSEADLDLRIARRVVTEERVANRAALERRQRPSPTRLGASIGYEQADGALLREGFQVSELELGNDEDGELGGLGRRHRDRGQSNSQS
jgi:hypothetical protein